MLTVFPFPSSRQRPQHFAREAGKCYSGLLYFKKYVMRIPRLYLHGLSDLLTDIQELDRIVLGEIVQKTTVGEEQDIDGVQHQGITT